jgi:bifunctional non-homologous end joining protein LigD
LKQIIAPVSGMQVHGHVENRGKDLFQLAKRSPDWLKIKARPQQEFVVCGFTEEKGSRKHFGALLLGAYRNGKLRYFGHSGSGFTEKGLKETVDRLKPFFTDKSPFENPAQNS